MLDNSKLDALKIWVAIVGAGAFVLGIVLTVITNNQINSDSIATLRDSGATYLANVWFNNIQAMHSAGLFISGCGFAIGFSSLLSLFLNK